MAPNTGLPVPAHPDDAVALEQEVMLLEGELQQAEAMVNAFEHTVRTRLALQIRRMRELTALYKAQKVAKKDKRREQKRRGKNFREPTGLMRTSPKEEDDAIDPKDQDELKRLYRAAIVQVHPDKFPEAGEVEGRHAAALTVHLNDLYERGDLEALRDFHEHILGEGPMHHTPYTAGMLTSQKGIVQLLQKKKEQLLMALAAIRQSQTFQLATADTDLASVLEDLRQQFDERIAQLERRTRQ